MKQTIVLLSLLLVVTFQASAQYDQYTRQRWATIMEEKLAAQPRDTMLQRQAGEAYFQLALEDVEVGERQAEQQYWHDGYYFYAAVTLFADALRYGHDKQEIDSLVRLTNAMAVRFAGEFDQPYRVFEDTMLYKMTSSYQRKNKHIADSTMEALRTLDESTIDKKVLYGHYTTLMALLDDCYYGGKYCGREPRYQSKKAKLRIQLGDINGGCLEYYNLDPVQFRYYPEAACNAWYKKYSAEREIAYKAQEKSKAKAWYAAHPKHIKFLSLMGEGTVTVESYLGAPIATNYKLSSGIGASSNQYTGKKYKNHHGVYEVGYHDDVVTFIKFIPPAGTIVYNPEKNESMVDTDSGERHCSYIVDDGFVGSVRTHSFDFDCASNDIQRVTFYGIGGKLSSVQAY